MKNSLGKGLSHLLADQFQDDPTTAPANALVPNPRQPRRTFDQAALEELASSIREHGILNPIVVRPISGGKYEVIAGERRLRASKLAGLTEVPIRILQASDQASLEMALIENLQREDIGPVESAHAYAALASQFSLTQDEVAAKVGKSRSAVTNTLRLLKLPDPILKAVESGELSEGHARAILSFESPAEQLAAFKVILEKSLSVRQTEELSRRRTAPKRDDAKPKREHEFDHIEARLAENLGSPVKITANKAARGHITIQFFSSDELDRLLETLGASE